MNEDILFRYVTDNTDANETAEVIAWLRERENMERYISLKNAWVNAGLVFRNETATVEEIQEVIKKATKAESFTKTPQKISLWATYSRIAAVISPILLATTLWLFLGDNRPEQNMLEISVPYGSLGHYVLRDGTEVDLNAGSRLRVKEFGETREVYLEGEGYFKVDSNPNKPFLVHTPEMDVKVTGTAFNVKAYEEERQTSTTLVEGKVTLEYLNQQGQKMRLGLLPGETGIFDRKTKTSSKKPVNGLEHSWKDGTVRFKDLPFGELALRIRRMYDVNIVFETDFVKSNRYSGSLDINSPLEDALSIIRISLPDGVTMDTKDKTVFIRAIK
ncbi:FecR family protein [Fulvitalea axinellae]